MLMYIFLNAKILDLSSYLSKPEDMLFNETKNKCTGKYCLIKNGKNYKNLHSEDLAL